MIVRPVIYQTRDGWGAGVKDETGRVLVTHHPPLSSEEEAQGVAVAMCQGYTDSYVASKPGTLQQQRDRQVLLEETTLRCEGCGVAVGSEDDPSYLVRYVWGDGQGGMEEGEDLGVYCGTCMSGGAFFR